MGHCKYPLLGDAPAPKTRGFHSLEGWGAAFPLGCVRIQPLETGSWPNAAEGLWHSDSD